MTVADITLVVPLLWLVAGLFARDDATRRDRHITTIALCAFLIACKVLRS